MDSGEYSVDPTTELTKMRRDVLSLHQYFADTPNLDIVVSSKVLNLMHKLIEDIRDRKYALGSCQVAEVRVLLHETWDENKQPCQPIKSIMGALDSNCVRSKIQEDFLHLIRLICDIRGAFAIPYLVRLCKPLVHGYQSSDPTGSKAISKFAIDLHALEKRRISELHDEQPERGALKLDLRGESVLDYELSKLEHLRLGTHRNKEGKLFAAAIDGVSGNLLLAGSKGDLLARSLERPTEAFRSVGHGTLTSSEVNDWISSMAGNGKGRLVVMHGRPEFSSLSVYKELSLDYLLPWKVFGTPR